MFAMQAIGYVRSPYKARKDVPRGLGAKHEVEGVLEIAPEFEIGLPTSKVSLTFIVIWAFDRSTGYELTATPPTDYRPHGVFATRSPFRPNPIGLTVVSLLRRDGARLHVRGIDMLDGTPILDIKPYLSSVPRRAVAARMAGRGGSTREAVIRQCFSRLPFRRGAPPRRGGPTHVIAVTGQGTVISQTLSASASAVIDDLFKTVE